MAFYRQITRERTLNSLEELKVRDTGLKKSISNFLRPVRSALFFSSFEIKEDYCSIGCATTMKYVHDGSIGKNKSSWSTSSPIPQRVLFKTPTLEKIGESSEYGSYVSTESSESSKKMDNLKDGSECLSACSYGEEKRIEIHDKEKLVKSKQRAKDGLSGMIEPFEKYENYTDDAITSTSSISTTAAREEFLC